MTDIQLSRRGFFAGLFAAAGVAALSVPALRIVAPPLSAGWINVLDYGADPTGQTDSTVAIQLATAAASARGGGTIYFPSGTYYTGRVLGG